MGIGERRAPSPVFLAHRTIGGAGPGAGGPRGVRWIIAHVRGRESSAAGGSAVPSRACAGRSVTKSRLGGGDEARPLRSLPTLSTSPALHVKRNNLFILGFKNPALLPVLRGRPAPPPCLPSSPRSCPVPPAAPPSSLSSSSSPPSPSLLGRDRGGGSGKRFVRLAAQLSPGGRGLGGARHPAAPLPPPRSRAPRAKKRRTRF